MEHACYKCGASVEDGTPFCPQCNAPQIRVGVIEAPAHSGAAAEGTILSPGAPAVPLGAGIEWVPAMWSAMVSLSAAIFLAVLHTPLGLALLGAGFLCVLLYRRRSRAGRVSPGLGAKLGALTGALGFGLLAATLGLSAALGLTQQIRDTFLKQLQSYGSEHSSDPHVAQLIELSKTQDGFTILICVLLVMTLVAFLIFSGMGGVIGALLLRRKDRM